MSRLALVIIASVSIVVLMSWAEGTARQSFAPGDTINIMAFGAKGNGITNDYEAFRKVVELVNNNGGGIVLLPKGTYFLEKVNDEDSIKQNFDLLFKDCNGVKIIGDSAVISVNGRFHRNLIRQTRRFAFTKRNQIVPLYFRNCSDIEISGLVIDGNVDQMTRDKGVVEKGQGLITIRGCDRIILKDLVLHHGPSDGIYIGPAKKNSTALEMENVKCLNNARQGISITGLRGGIVRNCTFSDTGFTGGEYGYHRPAAGVDIEPVKLHGGVKTGDILFEDCILENNYGGNFLCTSPSFTSNISIRKSRFKGTDAFSRYELILAADSVTVDSCDFDLGAGNIFPTWKPMPGSVVRITNNTIKSSLNGILSSSLFETDTVYIANNTFIFTGEVLTSYFPYLQTRNLKFENNKVFIPSKSIRRKYTSLVQNAKLSKGNLFYSDSTYKKAKPSYQNTKEVRDEPVR
jgi:hypothetical protein